MAASPTFTRRTSFSWTLAVSHTVERSATVISTALGSFLNSPPVTARSTTRPEMGERTTSGPGAAVRAHPQLLQALARPLQLALGDGAVGLRLLQIPLGADAVVDEVLLPGVGALGLGEPALGLARSPPAPRPGPAS